ncbi:MAG: hypothetical protein RBR74_08235, partial [Ignavibacteriaceae bacterium]|nr:hypothetical protein [Ignavibacteriaceae bacterium]
MISLLEENIEKILDDFSLVESEDNDDIFAREHYKEIFTMIFPKTNGMENKTTIDKSDIFAVKQITKNIVVIGAGYGGLTASLR